MRKLPEALDALEQSMKLPGARIAKPLALGRIYALLGRRDDALAVLRRTQQAGAAGGAGAQSTALLYFAVGDKEEGFKWLKKAFDERNLVTFIKFDPNFDSVRSDARFQQLIAMLHIPDPH
jgi:tetratricopeptide (TPR) repeat protein